MLCSRGSTAESGKGFVSGHLNRWQYEKPQRARGSKMNVQAWRVKSVACVRNVLNTEFMST